MKLITKSKKLIKVLLGRDFNVSCDIECSMEKFGNGDYGGWTVAVDYISAESIVYSFGVGEDISFDLALIERYGVTIHAFDPTPRSIEWVQSQKLPENFRMHPYGLAGRDGHASFNPPENPLHISHTLLDRPETSKSAMQVEIKTLQTIMRELYHDRIDLLKIDIEGSEYEVIKNMAECGIRPKQILVEYHHRFKNVGVLKTTDSIRVLRSMGYILCHVSERNEELTFILNAA